MQKFVSLQQYKSDRVPILSFFFFFFISSKLAFYIQFGYLNHVKVSMPKYFISIPVPKVHPF